MLHSGSKALQRGGGGALRAAAQLRHGGLRPLPLWLLRDSQLPLPHDAQASLSLYVISLSLTMKGGDA